MAAERTPVGREETQIGRIEELMATPERRVKRKGERAIVIRSSGAIEDDWVIENFDPETGAAVVSKRDERGKLLKKEIPREEFLATNFYRSEEMLGMIDSERRKIASRTIFSEKAFKRQERDLRVLDDIKESFARGDIGPMRKYFAEKMRELEARFRDEGRVLKERRRELLTQIEKLEKELAELERNYAFARSLSEQQKISAEIGVARNVLNPARLEFESITQKLELGHKELDDARSFVSILDQEIERRSKIAA